MTHPAPQCPEGYDQESVISYLCDAGASEARRRFAEHLESTGCEACTDELRSLRLVQESLDSWKPATERVDHSLWAMAADEAAHQAPQCPEGYDQESAFSYLCDAGESQERRRFTEHLESTGCAACTQELQSLGFLQESLNKWTPSTERDADPLWAVAGAESTPDTAGEPVPRKYAYAPAAAAPQRSFVLRHAWGLGFAATLVVAAAVGLQERFMFMGVRPVGERETQAEELASRAALPDPERGALAPSPPDEEQEPGPSLSTRETLTGRSTSRMALAEPDAFASSPAALEPEPVFRRIDGVVPAADRVALVVGNGEYEHIGRLANPDNDAADISAALGRLGFEVTTSMNSDRAVLTEALRTFTRRSVGADVALVFYAGHGMEMDGVNYLLPVDARLERDTDVRYETVTLDDVLAATTGASLRLVILDACRNTPQLRSMRRTVAHRSISQGFAELDTDLLGADVLVSYAAAAGMTAEDGEGRNSPYTKALLAVLNQPLELELLFREVRSRVLAATSGGQRPQYFPSLTTRHYLSGVAAAAVRVDAVASEVAPEQLGVVQLSLLAEQGDLRAQDELGERYREGAGGLVQDYAEALRWFRRAAEQGDAFAQVNLGLMYSEGYGVPQDSDEELRWYRLAAEQGHAHGQSNVGVAYMNGTGVQKDYDEALRWLRLAAKQRNVFGQVNLGVMYEYGRGVPQDYAEAAQWYRLAAERDYTSRTHPDDRAIAFAQVQLGYLYEDGLGVRQDSARAVDLYRLAGDQGDADAQVNLGFMYESGRGVGQDDEEAVHWYRLAAQQEDSSAQARLGFIYENGRSVGQDYAEAVRWYRLAAEGGDAFAQSQLGRLYEDGYGGRQDPEQAIRWYRLAAGQGDPTAQNNLDRLREIRAEASPSVADASTSPSVTECSQDIGRLQLGTQQHEGAWDGSCASVYYSFGEYARYFEVELTRPTLVTIELMSSVTVDTWLALRTGSGAGGALVEEDDDGGDGWNARIARVLDAGRYTIEATTRYGNVTGPFTLTVTAEENRVR